MKNDLCIAENAIEKMKEIVKNVCNKLGWTFTFDRYIDQKTLSLEVQEYGFLGQDFSAEFWADFSANSFDDLLKSMYNYIENFDADYEASKWIGEDGHGKNGAPYHIKDIVDEMQGCCDDLEKLYDELKNAYYENN